MKNLARFLGAFTCVTFAVLYMLKVVAPATINVPVSISGIIGALFLMIPAFAALAIGMWIAPR